MMRQASKLSPDACGRPPYELPRYFPGQLLTDDELTQEQRYFRERLKLHNRMLWGWGTVCGALVCRMPADDGSNTHDPWKVKVKPGYLLGPYGDDIVIEGEVVVDLRKGSVSGSASEAPEIAAEDPWCSRPCRPREPGDYWIAVRYRECLTRPVPVPPAACGCAGEDCEYSRVHDGYEIGILDDCPPSHRVDPPDFVPCREEIPECPPCPGDPWVVLAKLDVNENGIVGEPDNCACRRIVVSLAPFWCRAGEQGEDGGEATITGIDWRDLEGTSIIPAEFSVGDAVKVKVEGSGFARGSRIELGRGFQVHPSSTTSTTLEATVEVMLRARPGVYPLRVVDARGRTIAEQAEAFKVKAIRSGDAEEPEDVETPAPPGRKKKTSAKPRRRSNKKKGSSTKRGSGG